MLSDSEAKAPFESLDEDTFRFPVVFVVILPCGLVVAAERLKKTTQTKPFTCASLPKCDSRSSYQEPHLCFNLK